MIFHVIFSKILYPFVSHKRLSQTTAKVAIKGTILQFVSYTKICNIRMLRYSYAIFSRIMGLYF